MMMIFPRNRRWWSALREIPTEKCPLLESVVQHRNRATIPHIQEAEQHTVQLLVTLFCFRSINTEELPRGGITAISQSQQTCPCHVSKQSTKTLILISIRTQFNN